MTFFKWNAAVKTLTFISLFFLIFCKWPEQQTQAWHLKQLSALWFVGQCFVSADQIKTNPVIWCDDNDQSRAEIAWNGLTFKACSCGWERTIFWVSRHYFEPREAGSSQTSEPAPLSPQRPLSYMIKITADYWMAEAISSLLALLAGSATETHSTVIFFTHKDRNKYLIQITTYEFIMTRYNNTKSPL